MSWGLPVTGLRVPDSLYGACPLSVPGLPFLAPWYYIQSSRMRLNAWPLFLVLFLPILYIIKLLFSFWSQKTKETFINDINEELRK